MPPEDHTSPRRASVPLDQPDPIATLSARLGQGPFALVLLFVGTGADLPGLLARAAQHLGPCAVAGCTTAGEIDGTGYGDRNLVGVAFPASGFAAETVLIDPIDTIEQRSMIARLQQLRQRLRAHAERLPHELAVLLVDGLSGREEHLIASLAGGLGPVPTIGCSAGDGREFRRTQVFSGLLLRDHAAAVLCLLRSRMPLQTFSFNSSPPSRTQMVVTRADPVRRIVLRIMTSRRRSNMHACSAARWTAWTPACSPADRFWCAWAGGISSARSAMWAPGTRWSSLGRWPKAWC